MSNEEVPVLVPQTLRDSLKQYNQEHVLTFIDNGTVTGSSATDLLDQLNLLDLSFLQNIFQASTSEDTADSIQASDSTRIEPLDTFHALDESSHEDQVAWREMGLAALCRGTVAAIVLSGGQGTRLGFAGPKGMYDIGLPSGKTLFELFALRLLRLNTLTCSSIPWYIMTSPMNHETTVAFFKEHQYFGLPTESVMMFPQGTLPCFTKEGKLILETPCRLAQASDGNGGIYTALYKSGALADMQKRGILYAHAFAVDNAACKVADPIFIGYCIAREADVGNKVVWKSSSAEKVGIVAKRGGKYCVVEYSEMDEETKALKDVKTGKLVYGAGNICNHFYTVDFLSKLKQPLNIGYHVAHKKIPYVDLKTGKSIVPVENSGIKLESFIFDVFPLSQNMAVLSVPRNDEFAPVKNAPGSTSDSPDTARQMISEACKSMLTPLCTVESTGIVEIVPTLAYDRFDTLLLKKQVESKTITAQILELGSSPV